MSQVCTICLKEKADEAFRLIKGRAKRDCACKGCRQEYHREYLKQWRIDNGEKNRALGRQSYHRNRAKCILRMKARYQNKREAEIARVRAYQKNNPEMCTASERRRLQRRKANPVLRLRHAISVQIRHTLGTAKNRIKTERLLGYTIQELKAHLEKRFTKEMSWNNYGRAWHIDHIIPVSVFNIASPEDPDVRRCWALKNLRPLSCHDNCSKQAKLSRLFQPMLSLANGKKFPDAVKELQ